MPGDLPSRSSGGDDDRYSDKVAYLLNFYISSPPFTLSYPAFKRAHKTTAKLTHRIHLDEDRLSLNSIPLIIITKKPNRVFLSGYWFRGLRACQYF